jgi:hypothetical protein
LKSTWLYRITAILLVLFATAHTFGFLKFIPPTPEGRAVLDGMNTVSLQPGSVYTFGGFYRGFGLFVTAYLLFSAYLAWYLGSSARRLSVATGPSAGIATAPAAPTAGIPNAAVSTPAGSLPWVFCFLQLVSLAITCKYFPAPPIISSALVALFSGLAAAFMRSVPRPTPSENR